MKYNNTHRSLNTVLFGILTAGFVALTVFYTFIWAPSALDLQYAASSSIGQNARSVAFNLNLGTLFLALAIVSGIGFFFSIKSMFNDKNDQLVVNSFLCYITIGYVAAIFFVLNAIWLYDLIGLSQRSFWIVLCIIGAIISLIAANVPAMKLLEDDKTNRLSVVVATSFAAITVAGFVNFFYTAIVGASSQLSIGNIKNYPFVGAAICAVAAVLNILAVVIYNASAKKNKPCDLANYLVYLSLIVFAVLPLVSGIYELSVYNAAKADAKISLITLGKEFAGKKYCTTAIVTGSLIVVAALVLIINNIAGKKKESK